MTTDFPFLPLRICKYNNPDDPSTWPLPDYTDIRYFSPNFNTSH